MGWGDTRALPPDKDQDELLPSEISRLSDAPVLLFVYFHKAFRAQLVELRRLTADAAENGSYGRILAAELCRKFEFLKLVYKYHCAAEDEVVFLALDSLVKNVAFNYLLEHAEVDDLFSSIFHWLHVLEEDRENINDVFREVVFCIGTLQSSIHQHMLKEERQVFPLLIEKFSFQEQASLMWQYICSVPVMLLEDLLPWIMSFLSSEEQTEVENCMKEIVPNEDSLQQVVSSWLLGNSQSFGSFMKIVKGVQCADRSESTTNSLQMHQSSGLFQRFWRWSKTSFFTSDSKCNPIDGLQLWHNVIKKGLRDIQEELCQIEVPSTSLHLDVIVVQLNFLTDVLMFYSNAFKKVLYPLLGEIPDHHALPGKQFLIESYIEKLQRLLYQNAENKMEMSKYCLKLKGELESLIMEISKQFSVQETEVFPVISQNCSHELQQQILYMSLHVLPLGLLKSVIIWFSGHLSEHESQSILHTLSREDNFPNKSFANLLLLWFRLGFSGKISVENFGKELSIMFKGRCFFQKECTEEASGSFSQQTELQLCNGSKRDLLCCPEKGNKFLSHLLSLDSPAGSMYQTPYSSGMNLQIFFPGKLRLLHTVPEVFYEKTRDDPLVMDLKPVDIIFFFHKAMKNDLDYLVSGSAKLAADFRFLGEFQQRFHLMKFMYQIHSDAEDEIAFPALEAKGRLENISQSYTIDHELEAEHFNKVSIILNEMSELDFSNCTVSSNVLDLRKQKYEQLCLSLQDICKSMHKLLSEHVHREEIELWSLFRECFSVEEQEKIMARMLGRIPGETLQDMIPWLMESLIPEEQHAVILLWRHTTRKTMFAEWLAEWYDGHGTQTETEVTNNNPSGNPDPLEIVLKYLHEGHSCEKRGSICSKRVESLEIDVAGVTNEPLGKGTLNDKIDASDIVGSHHGLAESKKVSGEGNINRDMNQADNNCQINNPAQTFRMSQNSRRAGQPMQYESLLTMSQEDLEATIRRISCDSSLDPQKKSYIMQNLLMSRWIVTQQIYNSEPSLPPTNGEAISGQHPSYRDPFKLIFGCEHYKRNCKLLTPCCNQLFTCIRCHDEVADHLVDRKLITKIMCMKCLTVQPISLNCSNPMCNSLSMGKYYCNICKLFDDERKIYHCPYCNICRLGKGLGIDYFHCMKCNACMSLSLSEHVCREKCLEENCPICHEYIFTSSSPVKALPCGHLMHSACFQEYTCSHYTCPICSKSLGDMQVYFRMLDALLAEETMPDEYSNQTQVILCNDCERKGNASYHWLYHKCPFCGSYNTRLL